MQKDVCSEAQGIMFCPDWRDVGRFLEEVASEISTEDESG